LFVVIPGDKKTAEKEANNNRIGFFCYFQPKN